MRLFGKTPAADAVDAEGAKRGRNRTHSHAARPDAGPQTCLQCGVVALDAATTFCRRCGLPYGDAPRANGNLPVCPICYRTVDADGRLLHTGQLEQAFGDPLRHRFEEVAGVSFHDLLHQLVRLGVVDGGLEAVAGGRLLEVAHQLDVHGEAGAQLALGGEHAVAAEEGHALHQDAVHSGRL